MLVTHEGKRRKMIRPDEKYLRDNYPLRIASVSQSGERVAVAGSRGLTLWSRRSSKWIMFGNRTEEQMFTCDAMCWWNDVVLIAVVRRHDDDEESDDTHHELVALPYWQLKLQDSHSIMDPVSIPSSSSSPQSSGVRISCNANTIVVSSTNEIVAFSVTSHNVENWGYKCKNRLSLTPKFVVCGAYAHISQMLSSSKLKTTNTTKTLWYRRGSSNRIASLKLTSSSVEEEQDTNHTTRRALVRRSSSTSSTDSIKDTSSVLVDDGLSSFDLKWSSQQYRNKFDSLWSFEKGKIVLRSLGTRSDLKSCRTYVQTDEWPLAMTLPRYVAYLVVPVIGKNSFDFRMRSRSCLHVVLYSILSDDKDGVKDVVALLRCILDDDRNNESFLMTSLINVLCRAAKSKNHELLRHVRMVLRELKCEDSYDALIVSAAYQSDEKEWPFLLISEAFLVKMLSVSITKSNALFYDTMKIAVKCLSMLKRLRFSSDSTKKNSSLLRLHHSNNLSLLVAAISTGNIVVVTETWHVLSRIELECKSMKQNCDLICLVNEYVSSQIAENLISCSSDDLSLVTMWIACIRVPLSLLCISSKQQHKQSKKKRVLENTTVIRNVHARLSRLCRVVIQAVTDKTKLDAIVKILEFSEHRQLALLCAITLGRSEFVSRYEVDYPLMSRSLNHLLGECDNVRDNVRDNDSGDGNVFKL